MTKIPVYYIWSQNYEIFAKILKQGIQFYPFLEDQGEFIDQSFFDQHLNKAPGHFLTGCFLKLQKQYDLLHSLPEGSYFIFCDADVLFFPQKRLDILLNLFIQTQTDLVFMRETPDMPFSNVGFGLYRVCDATKKLFARCLEMAKEQPTQLDGTIINDAMKEMFTGSHAYFPPEFVMTTSSMRYYDDTKKNMGSHRANCMVFQALCDPGQSREAITAQKLKQYQILGVPISFT